MKRILGFILAFILVGAAGYGVNYGLRFVRENNNIQRRAEISLNDVVSRGEDFPIGKYVGLNARWILGPYASETSTQTTNGIAATAKETQYYFAVLEDGSVMTVASENKSEVAAMNRISDALVSAGEYITNGESIYLQGNLREMKQADLVRLCDRYAQQFFGMDSADSGLRHVYLDTSAGRDSLYLVLVGAVALAAAVLVIRGRKKKKQQAAAA